MIKGNEYWKPLRKFYLEQKCVEFEKNKEDQKISSSIFLEAINHSIQVNSN